MPHLLVRLYTYAYVNTDKFQWIDQVNLLEEQIQLRQQETVIPVGRIKTAMAQGHHSVSKSEVAGFRTFVKIRSDKRFTRDFFHFGIPHV